jgi:hypothetical protein
MIMMSILFYNFLVLVHWNDNPQVLDLMISNKQNFKNCAVHVCIIKLNDRTLPVCVGIYIWYTLSPKIKKEPQ